LAFLDWNYIVPRDHYDIYGHKIVLGSGTVK